MSTQRCPSCGAPAGNGRFCGTCGMRLVQQSAPPRPAPAASAIAPHAPNTVLDGRYRIVRALASGAMGAVYQAEDLRLGNKPRALKELLQHWGNDAERAEAEVWFRREGETLMGLQHPAIPQVHDTFSDGMRHYLVMDLVEGRTLEQVLAEEGTPGLAEDRVLSWADQILDVLSYLHSRPDPLIFRDLKPANVIVTPAGKIRLIDFGIARVFTQQGHGTAIGTPGYAPPEQYQGLAEPASDLYALGATMHHLLTGRDPRRHRPFDFPPVRSLAPHVGEVVALTIDRSLVLDPRQRYGTAADMSRALHATTLSGAMPRTVSGSLARGSGAMPVLPGKNQAPVPIGTGAGVAIADPRAIRVRPQELQIATAGNTVLTRLDHRTARLRNRTNARIQLAFDSDVPWLRPDPQAAVLEPRGKLDVSLAVVGKMPIGDHLGTLRIHGGGQTWSAQVRLRSRGADAIARRGAGRALSRVAALCLTVGLIATILGMVGIQIMAGAAAWNLLVIGLVGSVVLGVLRSGKGP